MSHIDEGTLHSYLDGEVSERQRTEIEGHLATCEECRTRLETAEALSARAADLLAELEPSAVQAPSWREIEERAEARRSAAPRRVRLRPGLAWAASIALAFAIGWASRGLYFTLPAFDVAGSENVVGAIEAADPTEARELRVREAVEPGEAQPAGGRQEAFRASEPDMTAIQPRAKTTPEEEATTRTAVRGQVAEDAPTQPERDARPAEANEQEEIAVRADEIVVVAPPAAAAGIEVRAREEGEAAAAVPVDRAPQEPTVYAIEPLALRRDADAELPGFFEVRPDEAPLWLGVELRTLPELTLERVEIGPGAAVAGAQSGLPAIRLVYTDAAGSEIVLIQQWVRDLGPAVSEIEPGMTIEPSGHRAYRWLDGEGYLLILEGNISGDSLRALADRIE